MSDLLIIYRNTNHDVVLTGTREAMTALFDSIFSARTKGQAVLKVLGESGDVIMISPVDIVHMAISNK